jgi:hypothetical protein
MENKNMLEVLKFEKNNIPTPYESKEVSDNKYVNYGVDNLYPNFLLGLLHERSYRTVGDSKKITLRFSHPDKGHGRTDKVRYLHRMATKPQPYHQTHFQKARIRC